MFFGAQSEQRRRLNGTAMISVQRRRTWPIANNPDSADLCGHTGARVETEGAAAAADELCCTFILLFTFPLSELTAPLKKQGFRQLLYETRLHF